MYTGVPIRVGYTAKAGRGVFAVRDIADGELIHTADPVVAHPSIQSMHKVFIIIIPQNILTNGCLSKCTLGARFCFQVFGRATSILMTNQHGRFKSIYVSA